MRISVVSTCLAAAFLATATHASPVNGDLSIENRDRLNFFGEDDSRLLIARVEKRDAMTGNPNVETGGEHEKKELPLQDVVPSTDQYGGSSTTNADNHMTPSQNSNLAQEGDQGTGMISSAVIGTLSSLGDVHGFCAVTWSAPQHTFGGKYSHKTSRGSFEAHLEETADHTRVHALIGRDHLHTKTDVIISECGQITINVHLCGELKCVPMPTGGGYTCQGMLRGATCNKPPAQEMPASHPHPALPMPQHPQPQPIPAPVPVAPVEVPQPKIVPHVPPPTPVLHQQVPPPIPEKPTPEQYSPPPPPSPLPPPPPMPAPVVEHKPPPVPLPAPVPVPKPMPEKPKEVPIKPPPPTPAPEQYTPAPPTPMPVAPVVPEKPKEMPKETPSPPPPPPEVPCENTTTPTPTPPPPPPEKPKEMPPLPQPAPEKPKELPPPPAPQKPKEQPIPPPEKPKEKSPPPLPEVPCENTTTPTPPPSPAPPKEKKLEECSPENLQYCGGNQGVEVNIPPPEEKPPAMPKPEKPKEVKAPEVAPLPLPAPPSEHKEVYTPPAPAPPPKKMPQPVMPMPKPPPPPPKEEECDEYGVPLKKPCEGENCNEKKPQLPPPVVGTPPPGQYGGNEHDFPNVYPPLRPPPMKPPPSGPPPNGPPNDASPLFTPQEQYGGEKKMPPVQPQAVEDYGSSGDKHATTPAPTPPSNTYGGDSDQHRARGLPKRMLGRLLRV